MKPELFFYKCDVPTRKEEIPPFSKAMQATVVERSFKKDTSCFGKWREDNAGTIGQSFKLDIEHWKGHRFIKEDEERKRTENVLKENFAFLKDCFIHLISKN